MMGDRKFYMAKGSTYIEKQVNYVKGNQFFGKKEADDDIDSVAENHEYSSDEKVNAIVMAIDALVHEGEIRIKKDFAAIKKAIDDMALFDKFTNTSMLEILKKCNLPSSLIMQSDSSLKSLGITGTLPKWTIQGVTPEEKKRIIELGKSFKDSCLTYL